MSNEYIQRIVFHCLLISPNLSPLISAGSDFIAVNETVVFPMGSESGSTHCFDVAIVDDVISETDQSFLLQLNTSTPDVFFVAEVGGQATVTIIDDEGTH